MRRSRQARMEWGAALARRAKNARLARATSMAADRAASDQIGQILVLGFNQPPRLIEFADTGCLRSMRATDLATGHHVRVSTRLAWQIARIALPHAAGERGGQAQEPAHA